MKTIRDEKCRNELLARLDKLTPESKAEWGRMSAEQMLSHLVQVGELPWAGGCADRSSFMSRNVIKPLALYLLTMPKNIETSPDVDQQANGRKPAGLEADKTILKEAVNKLATMPLDTDCLPHPFFGKMSVKQWGLLSHKHIDHHFRQFGI